MTCLPKTERMFEKSHNYGLSMFSSVKTEHRNIDTMTYSFENYMISYSKTDCMIVLIA